MQDIGEFCSTVRVATTGKAGVYVGCGAVHKHGVGAFGGIPVVPVALHPEILNAANWVHVAGVEMVTGSTAAGEAGLEYRVAHDRAVRSQDMVVAQQNYVVAGPGAIRGKKPKRANRFACKHMTDLIQLQGRDHASADQGVKLVNVFACEFTQPWHPDHVRGNAKDFTGHYLFGGEALRGLLLAHHHDEAQLLGWLSRLLFVAPGHAEHTGNLQQDALCLLKLFIYLVLSSRSHLAIFTFLT
jgi:hypothetical protein